jgi:uncharacterized protein YkwD
MRRAVVSLLFLFFASCAQQQAVPVLPVPPPDPKTLMPALESRIYELVEQERHKLDPQAAQLALDSELVGVAREKSADMAVRNYMAHASPDGRTSTNIIMDEDAGFAGLLGENIAAQPYYVKYGVDVETFARRVVAIWMASKNHRENLADPAYLRTGIGAAVNGNTVYVTELFAANLMTPAPEQKRP